MPRGPSVYSVCSGSGTRTAYGKEPSGKKQLCLHSTEVWWSESIFKKSSGQRWGLTYENFGAMLNERPHGWTLSTFSGKREEGREGCRVEVNFEELWFSEEMNRSEEWIIVWDKLQLDWAGCQLSSSFLRVTQRIGPLGRWGASFKESLRPGSKMVEMKEWRWETGQTDFHSLLFKRLES